MTLNPMFVNLTLHSSALNSFVKHHGNSTVGEDRKRSGAIILLAQSQSHYTSVCGEC